MTPKEAHTIAQRIKETLPRCNDLRRRPWQDHPCPVAGHCYVASEALYHLLGGAAAGFTVHFIRHEDAPHWFLRDPAGQVLDLTAAQFETSVPYEEAKRKGFLTKRPSARAGDLAQRAGYFLGGSPLMIGTNHDPSPPSNWEGFHWDTGRRIHPKPSMDKNTPDSVRLVRW